MEPGDPVEAHEKMGDPYRPATYLGEARPLRWRDVVESEMVEIPRVRVRFEDGHEADIDAMWVRPREAD